MNDYGKSKDQSLDNESVSRLIKDVLPDTRIAADARDLFKLCCEAFVHRVGKEAERITSTGKRKLIQHGAVMGALSNLGFPDDYVEAADSVLDECEEQAEKKKLRKKNSRLGNCGIPEEQLYEMQQALIEKARQEQLTAQQTAMAQQLQPGSSAMSGASGAVDEDDEYDT